MVYLDAAVAVQFNDPGLGSLYKELGFADEDALEDFVGTYIIPGVEGRIADLTGKTYTDVTVPEALRMVGHQAVANVLAYVRTNRMGPVLQNPAGFNLAVPIVEAFTPELLSVVKSYVTKRVKATSYQTDKIATAWNEK